MENREGTVNRQYFSIWRWLFAWSGKIPFYNYIIQYWKRPHTSNTNSQDHFHHTSTQSTHVSKSEAYTLEHNTSLSAKLNIRVLTYNIFLRPPFVKNNADDFKNERLAEFIKVLDNYDVLAIQEIFALGNFRQRKLIEEAKRKGFRYHTRAFTPSLMSLKFIDGGLLILSRYPIVDSDAIIYSQGNQIDSWAAKQALYAKIQISKDHAFHIFTTHMQASYNDSAHHHNMKNDLARLYQVSELADFVKLKCQDHWPVIIAGDFNINAKKKNKHHFKLPHQKVLPGVTPEHLAREDCDREESEEYHELMSILTNQTRSSYHPFPVRELLKEQYQGRHPTTYGDAQVITSNDGQTTEEVPRETVLTHTADLCTQEAIDYIFWLDSADEKVKRSISLKEGSTRIEPFFVEDLEAEWNIPEKERGKLPFTQLSDHYGISTMLDVHPISNYNTSSL